MGESFYSFSSNPFPLEPDQHSVFESQSLRQAVAWVSRELALGKGIIELTGVPGVGKSSLAGYLLATIDPARLVARRLDAACLFGHDLVGCVARAFGLKNDGEFSALAALEAFLHDEALAGRQCLLVVDDCGDLSEETLAELRMLADVRLGSRPLMQILLLGAAASAALVLEPLGPQEIQSYVEHCLKGSGWNGQPEFDPALFGRMYELSGGVPRMVNQLCSSLLRLAAERRFSRIDVQMLGTVNGESAVGAARVEPTVMLVDPETAKENEFDPNDPDVPPSDWAERIAQLEQAVAELGKSHARLSPITAEGWALADIEERISAFEAKLMEQERTVHYTLAALIELFETGRATKVAA